MEIVRNEAVKHLDWNVTGSIGKNYKLNCKYSIQQENFVEWINY